MATSTIITIPGICTLSDAGDGKFEMELPKPLFLTALRDSSILMHQQDWYNDRPWAQAQVPAGKYAVRLPIPGSNGRTREEQNSLLLPGEKPIPVVLGALTLLGLSKAGNPDPLQNGWLRCAEETARGYRVVLHWYGGRLYVNHYWDDYRSDLVWAGGVRTS